MKRYYNHTQIGWLTIIVLAAAILSVQLLSIGMEFPPVAFWVTVILGICILMFPTLTTKVNTDKIVLFFGPGILRKTILLKDIESCKKVTTPWYYGFGIRYIGGGWLYNVSGKWSVEVKTKKGRRYRIGTDMPEDLEKAIKQAIKK